MSLFDIDKNSNSRGLPAPNQNDAQQQRMAHNTLSTTYKIEGGTEQRVVFKNNIILYVDDQGRIIGVDGFIPELSVYPVKIFAKYGYDVYTDILGLTPPAV